MTTTPIPTVRDLFQHHSVSTLAPEICLILFAFAVLLAGAFSSESVQRRLLPALALIGAAATGWTIAGLWNEGAVFGPTESAIFTADNFSLFFKAIFVLTLASTILLSNRFLQARSGDRHTVIGEFYGLLMLSTVGMMIVASASDLLVIFLGIETLSIALYILAGFARARLMSNEAALKYFLLGAFATGFLLYGIALTYFAVGSTHIPTLAAKIASGEFKSASLLMVGMALIVIGLGFKAALVPFHQWTPDVYEGSPTPVTAFMAVGAKAAAFAAILRILPEAFGALSPQWHPLVMALAVLTMTVGNLVALSQESIKRMLAYSSIAHAGYLLIGVVAAAAAARGQTDSLAEQQAFASVLFYLLTYALMNLGAFAVLVGLEQARERKSRVAVAGIVTVGDGLEDEDEGSGPVLMSELNGLATRQPFIAAAMTVFMISLAGIPPTAGFLGKFSIFSAAVDQQLYGLVIVGVINSVISVYYYLRPVVAMYATDAESQGIGAVVASDGTAVIVAPRTSAVSLSVGLVIVVFAVSVLAMIVWQRTALPLAESAALSLSSGVVGR
jgi:NADH-quinone oxidoreductase subunit N